MWFIRQPDGTESGPFSEQHIRAWVYSKDSERSSVKKGDSNWRSATEVRKIFEELRLNGTYLSDSREVFGPFTASRAQELILKTEKRYTHIRKGISGEWTQILTDISPFPSEDGEFLDPQNATGNRNSTINAEAANFTAGKLPVTILTAPAAAPVTMQPQALQLPPLPKISTGPDFTQPQTEKMVSRRLTKKTSSPPKWSIVMGASLISLAAGYFAGREHIKFEIRRAITEATQSLADGFGQNKNRTPSSNKLDESQSQLIRLKIDQVHVTPTFSIRLASAKIAKAQIVDMFGETGTGREENLIITLEINNRDDRKILRFTERNMFSSANFKLRDDVENTIRGVNYGAASRPVGALRSSDDILPGAKVTHVELFNVPLPKTQFVILTVNLECFGSDGSIEFEIPIDQISITNP
ncbi:MAG TPA: hypothetical protein DDZ51_09595 [Planctomycetaceae bacterium]|nr:hypothetical protein [Planctomycetaceae bacterium]